MFGRSNPPCPYCENLKTLLNEKGVSYVYKDISQEENFEEFMSHRLRTVPAVFIDGEFKGGFEDAKGLF